MIGITYILEKSVFQNGSSDFTYESDQVNLWIDIRKKCFLFKSLWYKWKYIYMQSFKHD